MHMCVFDIFLVHGAKMINYDSCQREFHAVRVFLNSCLMVKREEKLHES